MPRRPIRVVGPVTGEGVLVRQALRKLRRAHVAGVMAAKYRESENSAVRAGNGTAGSKMLAELMATGFVGLWKDRKDIKDSSAFARKLRERAQTRKDRDPLAG